MIKLKPFRAWAVYVDDKFLDIFELKETAQHMMREIQKTDNRSYRVERVVLMPEKDVGEWTFLINPPTEEAK